LSHRPAAIAANTWIWHCPLTQDLIEDRLRQLAGWGFEAVEMPLESIGDWDPRFARDLLDELNLQSLVGSVFAPGRELGGASPEVIDDTLSYVRACIDHAQAQGASHVIGPIYTSVGRTWRMTPAERSSIRGEIKENLRTLADYAGERGVVLGIEPLNRYETSLFNTCDQLMEIIDDLPESLGINLDTYHMNIEETSWVEALERAGGRLVHLQVCGNDRGAPGSDHSDWTAIGEGLASIGYSGPLGIESFTSDNETIATAASIWRPLAESQDALAVDGLRFLKGWRDSWAPQS